MGSVQIRWINHASFVVEHQGVRLICDPWLDGTAFDNGWALLSKTVFDYADFASITHIWFSHEHPDHFSPPNLKKIPEDARQHITVLYHETKDKKVVDYCRKLGFGAVVELKPDEWFSLSPDVRIFNRPFQADSWMCIQTPEVTLLNMNDCEVDRREDMAEIRRYVGRDVDVLFTQFSYAGFAGNQDDLDGRRKRANRKLQQMKLQVDVIGPKQVVPFASYVWFCHEENYYMNNGINTIRDACRFLQDELHVQPVVLYPGDVWDVSASHDSAASLQQYDVDYEAVHNNPPLIPTETVPPEDLAATVRSYVEGLLKRNSKLMIRRFPPAHVYVTDYGRSCQLSVHAPYLSDSQVPYDQCDVAMSSAALAQCMKFAWGGETIWIAGKLQLPKRGTFRNFKNFTAVGGLNNHGIKFGIAFACKYAVRRVANKIRPSTVSTEW